MHRTWNIENSHRAWVVDRAFTAEVECVIASVYQLLHFSQFGTFFSHIFKYFKSRVVKIVQKEAVLHEGFTV